MRDAAIQRISRTAVAGWSGRRMAGPCGLPDSLPARCRGSCRRDGAAAFDDLVAHHVGGWHSGPIPFGGLERVKQDTSNLSTHPGDIEGDGGYARIADARQLGVAETGNADPAGNVPAPALAFHDRG